MRGTTFDTFTEAHRFGFILLLFVFRHRYWRDFSSAASTWEVEFSYHAVRLTTRSNYI